VIEKHIRIFEKGLLKYDYVLDNYMDRFSQIKKYEYNAQNQIVSIKEERLLMELLVLIKIFSMKKENLRNFLKLIPEQTKQVKTFLLLSMTKTENFLK
jgi:hypothetical protein